MATLIYILNTTSIDLCKLLREKTSYNIKYAEPLKAEDNTLEKQIIHFKQLKSIFETAQKEKILIVIQDIFSEIKLENEYIQLLQGLPPKQKPTFIYVYTETSNSKLAKMFRYIPKNKIKALYNENQLLKILSKFMLFINRTVFSKNYKLLYIFLIIILMAYCYGKPLYILPTYLMELPLKNTNVEILQNVYFQNNTDEQAIVKIDNIAPDVPTIYNYNTSLISKKILIDGKESDSNKENQIILPPRTRRDSQLSYVFHVDSIVSKGNIEVSSSLIENMKSDYEKTLVKTNNDLNNKANEITLNDDNNNTKLMDLYKYTISKMHYTFDYQYAHKGAISAFNNSKGVCEDYASLFTSLADTVGIPCKYDWGMLITPSQIKNKFTAAEIYHAWPEVFFTNIGWVPVEVTYNDIIISHFIKDSKFAKRLFAQNTSMYISLNNTNMSFTVPKGVDMERVWLIRKVN